MSPHVFISHRRADAGHPAFSLYSALQVHLPDDQIFIDVGSISPGENFNESILNWLDRCTTMLVVIGPDWLNAPNKTRLHSENDPVRFEIREALKRSKEIIPVLLENVPMPTAPDLPADIQPFALRQAMRYRLETAVPDIEKIVQAIAPAGLEKIQRASRPPREPDDSNFHYLHSYLSNVDFHQARHHVRKLLSGKPFKNWCKTDEKNANLVAASYDQAQILLSSGLISEHLKSHFFNSSWGESICHQYELLSVYLWTNQAPHMKGGDFFRHFKEIYREASFFHPRFVIVSGGQTGADRAALDAAIELGIHYAGWVPLSGRAEDFPAGPEPLSASTGLLRDYPNLLDSGHADPAIRTMLNVENSDKTIILTKSHNFDRSPGTRLTIDHANAKGKPVIILNINSSACENVLQDWIGARNRPRLRLNIAGPRESEEPGIYHEAKAFLTTLLRNVHSDWSRSTDPGQ